MTEYKITMQQNNNLGELDVLYPKTLSEQVQGLLEPSTAELFGLLATAVPDDVFKVLSGYTKIESGTYQGTGTTGTKSLSFNFKPKILLLFCPSETFPGVAIFPIQYINQGGIGVFKDSITQGGIPVFGFGSYTVDFEENNNTVSWQIQQVIDFSVNNGDFYKQISAASNFNGGVGYSYIALA